MQVLDYFAQILPAPPGNLSVRRSLGLISPVALGEIVDEVETLTGAEAWSPDDGAAQAP